MSLIVVVEGDTDLPVARKLAREGGMPLSRPIVTHGKSHLDKQLKGYRGAAKGSPWLVLRDLDHDADCAPELLRRLPVSSGDLFAIRIVVRAVESWLLADRSAIARYLHVPASRVPTDPDNEIDPKLTIVKLARYSTNREVRKRMLPRPGSATRVGMLFEADLVDFGTNHWDIKRACKNSQSLQSAVDAMKTLTERWNRKVRGE